MFKEELPNNCPPVDSKEIQVTAYRFFIGDKLAQNEFIPYAKAFPDNPRFQICEGFAISVYDTVDNAMNALDSAKKRNKILGNYIAELELQPAVGKTKFKQKSGHYSIWFYKDWDVLNFKVNKITSI